MGFPGGSSVKSLPSVQETQEKTQEMRVWSPGGKDPLEEGHGKPLRYSCLEKPMDRGARRATVCGSQRAGHDWSDWGLTHLVYHSFMYYWIQLDDILRFTFMRHILLFPILIIFLLDYLVLLLLFSCSVMSDSLQPMDCSMQGFLIIYHLPGLAQTQVHWVDYAIQLSHPLFSPSLPALNVS